MNRISGQIRLATVPGQVAPIVACIVAAALLLLLMIPGVLTYPSDTSGETEVNAEILDAMESHAQRMRDRVAALEGALEGGMCLAKDGQFTIPGQEVPKLVQEALPAPPAKVTKTCAGSGGEGSVAQLVHQATVLIVAPDRGSGTGFFVRQNEILTNAHVVGNRVGEEVVIANAEIGPMKAEVIATGDHEDRSAPDLALLRVQQPANIVPLLFADVAPLSKVRAVGFPGLIMGVDDSFKAFIENPVEGHEKLVPVISAGEVIKASQENSIAWLYHDAFIDKGNSGGPLVDICGRVVGVNTQLFSRKFNQDDGGVPPPTINKALALESVIGFVASKGLEPLAVSKEPVPAP